MTSLIDNLYKRPEKESYINTPHYQVLEKNAVHQMDLMTMPSYKGYKYILHVVDLFNRTSDAKPLKNKTGPNVLRAFKAIYTGKYLREFPKVLHVDPGTEFADIKRFANDIEMKVRVGKVGRHRQQAIVEKRNGILAKMLFKKMGEEELKTGVVNRNWVDHLEGIVKKLNERVKGFEQKVLFDGEVVCEGKSCELLDVGTKVRTKLDNPESLTGDQKINDTRFRATDTRWKNETRTVKEILLTPGFPPMYLLDGKKGKAKDKEMVGYTRPQLQVITHNEKKPKQKNKRQAKAKPKPKPKKVKDDVKVDVDAGRKLRANRGVRQLDINLVD